MNQLYLQKNLPAPLQFLIRPMLLISLGLHGLVMIMPIQDAKKAEIPKKEEKVKISQLPSPVSSPTLKASPSPSLLTKPTPVASPPIPRFGAPLIRQQPVQSPVRQPIQQSKPNQTPAEQKQSPQASPSPSQQSSPTTANPWAKFPPYPGAQPGSGDVLKKDYDQPEAYVFNTTDAIDTVAKKFGQLLPLNGFQFGEPNPNQTDFRVYQVSKGNSSQYLHLISKDKKTAMLLSSKEYTLDQLKNAQVEAEKPEAVDFRNIMAKYAAIDSVGSLNFSRDDPDFKSLAEMDKFLDKDQNPDQNRFSVAFTVTPLTKKTNPQIIENLLNQLTSAGFKAPEIKKYGGGPVYEVKKNDFKIYLILAPFDSNNKTAVITTKESP